MNKNELHLVGYACGFAGADNRVGEGPLVVQRSSYFADLIKKNIAIHWDSVINSDEFASLDLITAVAEMCGVLAAKVSQLTFEKKFFCVIGGDHTSAIGTWSGVYDAMHKQGELGLIWIDAHMDSHTPETSESGRLHGMPLACLMGQGYSALTTILHSAAKIRPENLCLLGVRSYEKGEAEFLKKNHVKIYFMDEIKERGFQTVLREAVVRVKANTVAYGLSLDMDGIDPIEAPGVNVPEPDGIHFDDLARGLQDVMADSKLIGTEIVEFDPSRDKDRMTEKLVTMILKIFAEKIKLRYEYDKCLNLK